MSLLHSQFHESTRFDKIDMLLHIRKLFRHLFRIYKSPKNSVTPVNKGDYIYLSFTQAIPLGLIVKDEERILYEMDDKEKGPFNGKIEVF